MVNLKSKHYTGFVLLQSSQSTSFTTNKSRNSPMSNGSKLSVSNNILHSIVHHLWVQLSSVAHAYPLLGTCLFGNYAHKNMHLLTTVYSMEIVNNLHSLLTFSSNTVLSHYHINSRCCLSLQPKLAPSADELWIRKQVNLIKQNYCDILSHCFGELQLGEGSQKKFIFECL